MGHLFAKQMEISYSVPEVLFIFLMDSSRFLCLPQSVILKSYNKIIDLLNRLQSRH
jgi:hypothetical protein